MKFTKMHGLGNDYIYVYALYEPNDPAELSRKLSDRHFGVGSDGMIWILPSEIADWKMRIFNADGSEAKMCGNGIRCVGKYLYDKGYTAKTELTVETISGIRRLILFPEAGRVGCVSVDMGRVTVFPPKTFGYAGKEYTYRGASVGNPHAVIFTESEEESNNLLTTLGPVMEHDPIFPDGVNVEFVTVLEDGSLRMRVWERGSGVTMACGTGACAAAAAAVRSGRVREGRPVSVRLDGGILQIEVSDDGTVTMKGPAVTVYEGETEENCVLEENEYEQTTSAIP